MEIPSNIAARIGEIEARFTTPAVPAKASATPASTADGFASVLAASLPPSASVPTTGDRLAADPTIASLVASASASRTSALGLQARADERTETIGPIATSQEVKAIEDRYRDDNGRLPADALTSIGGSHQLNETAANAFQQLRASAHADGVEIGVTDSYRSYDAQVDVARRKGLYSQGGLAAKPGTSDHGLGLALDLDLDSPALNWMRANAGRFGFVEDTPRESWHWKFDGV